jgi:hypothetical protein
MKWINISTQSCSSFSTNINLLSIWLSIYWTLLGKHYKLSEGFIKSEWI